MLTLEIPGDEDWDDEAQRFVYAKPIVLQFEHSLVSLSKWEEKYHQIFLTKKPRTEVEMADYIKAMCVTPNVSEDDFNRLREEDLLKINDYINDPMTATTFSELPGAKGSTELISAELILYWMQQFGIPYEMREAHLNKLFTMIRVHHAKQQKPKKMPKEARVQSMAEINAARKARLGTKG